ncbi:MULTISPECIES: YkgJ family cysteine cluster protein [unclassified Clostridioides]|uniref:YkgJ family cysteine cluster protein n=1 Tax=unclassified Clostridioides TaxID=2635829 RepID=UPI001D128C76|nr:YkgJ family cysteine cluster protein [Clostridioides sp. ZZV14-6150]MCC0661859.1 YkgJ family cysteine cluster protein [Clostridioides sp. ZZV14-6154]MCC0669657.1 YkgJ family cysteine cluster protein [Clostridioides sp. ZZV14-6153]MCC0718918.1 YkgJ family cysteine cluster protein [Clostridioides sp. ZZV14-6105]MCC0723611.1 YkgJ family cysteine cluster protein [Clostridioides sp. ZZV14-6104]MCC0727008.1 YkgJ family cysteine cluster protein [Clostridioides sp. ZZV14-6045]MCC0731640.1 YkgJ fam
MTSIKNKDILNCIDYSTKNKLFNELNDVYESLPTGNCSGCGNCCMESVGINLIEFLNIFCYLEDRADLRRRCISKIVDYYFEEYSKKNSCPFKDDDNRCLIYEVRPLNCRLFGHWKKADYNKNLDNVTKKNNDYKELMKRQFGFEINDEVVNYRIDYCESFIPGKGYLSKSERLSFFDKLMILDSKLYSNGIIDIDFKDRGIVEYFIESLFYRDLAYNVKIRISKEPKIKKRTINRIKRLILLESYIK